MDKAQAIRLAMEAYNRKGGPAPHPVDIESASYKEGSSRSIYSRNTWVVSLRSKLFDSHGQLYVDDLTGDVTSLQGDVETESEPPPPVCYVVATIACLYCSIENECRFIFSWGHCYPYQEGDSQGAEQYTVGDLVRWRTSDNGTTPSWFRFPEGDANVGTCDIIDLIVLDRYLRPFGSFRCPNCGYDDVNAAMEIRDGRIVKVSLLVPDVYDENSEYFQFSSDGFLIPIPDISVGLINASKLRDE